MSLPRLHGERVTLHPVSYDVARAVLRGSAPELRAALGPLEPGPGWPHTDTPDALRPLAEHGGPGQDGGWLVVVDGRVVGDCGWLGGPGPDGDCEVGYGLAAPARGQGLGLEAVAVLVAWAEQQPGVRRVVADVLPGNEPSLRLLARLGFTVDVHASVPPHLHLVRDRDRQRVRGKHVC